MKDSNKRKLIESTLGIFSVILLYTVFHFVGIGCPIKFFTGISCAGCGMSRAWLSVLKLDFCGAFYYHPLFWMVPIGFGLFIFKRKISTKVFKGLVWTGLIILLAVYVWRLIDPNDNIVVIDIKNGAIIRFISQFMQR